MKFTPFPKIGRYSREVIVTEKIDGTNACVGISLQFEYQDGVRPLCSAGGYDLYAGSRSQWLTRQTDNFGFAKFAEENAGELTKLGPGRHFGEWWGSGIQRGYGLTKGEKRFSLFNTSRWTDVAVRPACCHVVPIIGSYFGLDDVDTYAIMAGLGARGSYAAPGFMKPEGIVIFHAQGNVAFKKTFEKDDAGKGREPVSGELT